MISLFFSSATEGCKVENPTGSPTESALLILGKESRFCFASRASFGRLANPSFVVGFPSGILDNESRKHSDGEAIDVFPSERHSHRAIESPLLIVSKWAPFFATYII